MSWFNGRLSCNVGRYFWGYFAFKYTATLPNLTRLAGHAFDDGTVDDSSVETRLHRPGVVLVRHVRRITTLRMMRILSRFRPRLIGSVMTGHVRQGSDIDLHVFFDNISAITMALDEILVPYDVERKCVRKDGKERIFTHSACYVVGISVTELHVQKRLAPRGEN